jgi:hypothetical protein
MAVATAALTASLASAAALGGLGGERVAAGDGAILACDGNGFSVGYTTVGGNVTSATVADIADPACEGGELSITVTDGAGNSIASGGPTALPADGDTAPNSVTLPVSPQPAAEQVAGAHVAVVGP